MRSEASATRCPRTLRTIRVGDASEAGLRLRECATFARAAGGGSTWSRYEQARPSGGTPTVAEGRDVPHVAKQPRFVGALAETLLGGGVALVHSDLGYVVLAHALDREGVERVRSMPRLPPRRCA